MGALNSYPLTFSPERSQTGRAVMDPPNAHGMRARIKPGPVHEEWDLDYRFLNNTERLAIRAIFEAPGYSGTILWTSPDDSSDRRYQFVKDSFRETTITAQNFSISFRLRHAPGVAV